MTPQEQLDAINVKLRKALSDVSEGDRRVSYDLVTLRKERDRLEVQISSQSASPRTSRTLLSMEPE